MLPEGKFTAQETPRPRGRATTFHQLERRYVRFWKFRSTGFQLVLSMAYVCIRITRPTGYTYKCGTLLLDGNVWQYDAKVARLLVKDIMCVVCALIALWFIGVRLIRFASKILTGVDKNQMLLSVYGAVYFRHFSMDYFVFSLFIRNSFSNLCVRCDSQENERSGVGLDCGSTSSLKKIQRRKRLWDMIGASTPTLLITRRSYISPSTRKHVIEDLRTRRFGEYR